MWHKILPIFKRAPEKKSGPTRAEALAAIPVINSGVTVEQLENGDLLLTYPVIMRPWIHSVTRRFGSPPATSCRKLQLDPMGASVWQTLDGKRTVGQIIDKCAQKYQLHPKEAEISVTQFLRSLGKRGVIGMR